MLIKAYSLKPRCVSRWTIYIYILQNGARTLQCQVNVVILLWICGSIQGVEEQHLLCLHVIDALTAKQQFQRIAVDNHFNGFVRGRKSSWCVQ